MLNDTLNYSKTQDTFKELLLSYQQKAVFSSFLLPDLTYLANLTEKLKRFLTEKRMQVC